jgi:hypothetical protein
MSLSPGPPSNPAGLFVFETGGFRGFNQICMTNGKKGCRVSPVKEFGKLSL